MYLISFPTQTFLSFYNVFTSLSLCYSSQPLLKLLINVPEGNEVEYRVYVHWTQWGRRTSLTGSRLRASCNSDDDLGLFDNTTRSEGRKQVVRALPLSAVRSPSTDERRPTLLQHRLGYEDDHRNKNRSGKYTADRKKTLCSVTTGPLNFSTHKGQGDQIVYDGKTEVLTGKGVEKF